MPLIAATRSTSNSRCGRTTDRRKIMDMETLASDTSGGGGGDASVVDVYDIASEIGKECEKIIDQYGADAVTALMPKVINALEMLESLATKNERENVELHELETKIVQLEHDKLEKAEYRQKFEKELEAIEEQWRSETKELVSLVSRLQDENRRLIKVHNPNHQTTNAAGGIASAHAHGQQQAFNGGGDEMLQRLKDTLEKQREDIRVKENLLQQSHTDIDNLKTQIERLTASGRELRRKHKSFQGQVRTLCDERADFLVQLQDQQRDIGGLRQRLGLAQKENEDLAKCDMPALPNNKAVFDLDDPNRPRFTIQELKDILHERNELKAKVSDLEDELEGYRPKATIQSTNPNKQIKSHKLIVPRLILDDEINNKSLLFPLDDDYDEDAPVQGPLPCEPDDAPWKRCSESGIRKFFRKIFSENGTGSSFPRRSLSTLSKMALSATNEPIPV